jgi:hypothetical protein
MICRVEKKPTNERFKSFLRIKLYYLTAITIIPVYIHEIIDANQAS